MGSKGSKDKNRNRSRSASPYSFNDGYYENDTPNRNNKSKNKRKRNQNVLGKYPVYSNQSLNSGSGCSQEIVNVSIPVPVKRCLGN